MIPKSCPFSDKLKLKLILRGEINVCQGHQEKNDKGIFERCKDCEGCMCFDKTLLNSWPWTYAPFSWPPSPPDINTTPNTAGKPITTTTITWTGNNTVEYNGNYLDNVGNYTYYQPLAKNRYNVSSLVSGSCAGSNLLYSSVV